MNLYPETSFDTCYIPTLGEALLPVLHVWHIGIHVYMQWLIVRTLLILYTFHRFKSTGCCYRDWVKASIIFMTFMSQVLFGGVAFKYTTSCEC